MWRGVAHAPAVEDGHTMIMAGHTRQKFVCYPIRTAREPGALPLINFIAELRFDARELSEREDWSKPGRLEDFLPAFEGWRFDWLDVPALIRSAERTWVYPMVDRDPLPRWTHGPVTLLGDAAHPMYPIGSNGASQAILDARVLTGCLRYGHESPSGTGALRGHPPARDRGDRAGQPRQGPEVPMQLVEDRAPNGFTRLDDVVSPEELSDRRSVQAGRGICRERAQRAPLPGPCLLLEQVVPGEGGEAGQPWPFWTPTQVHVVDASPHAVGLQEQQDTP